jgi:Na+/H+ antiporter NhaD/arsenite permease-like protein
VKVDDRLAGICKVVVSLMIITFFIVNVGEALGYNMHIDMAHIAVAAALVLLVLTSKRFTILRNVNYGIIVLFIAMFIFMHALAKTSFIDTISSYLLTTDDTLLNIVSASIILSQFMSNVPFVAFYTNVMHANGLGSENIKEWITLAGASTLAGNLTILGTASNLIILEEASKRRYSFTFLEFFKVGSIVTAANIAVLLSFITIIP